VNDSAAPDGPPLAPEDFLSGTSGLVFGKRATTRAVVADAVADSRALLTGRAWRLRRAATAGPERRVLALAVERDEEPNLLAAAHDELLRSKHSVTFASRGVCGRGKFENLNALLAEHPAEGHDWLLVLDDDVALPRGFLDAFLFLVERFGLRLAQPAHRARSHAAWEVTRRRAGSLVRETNYVEIGPVIAFHASTYEVLLPFPELRAGWGLDAHWAALARERDWPIGIVDATPVRHGLRRIAAAYDRADAIAEGRRFLADRPYVKASEAQQTLATHRRWT
jgi:predicted nucleic acid-binding protein